MAEIWRFISDPGNQKTLGWLGAGVCVIASGAWTVFRQRGAKPADPPAETTKPAVARQAASRDGIAAAGNIHAGRDVVVGDRLLPRLALVVGALGLVLLALALLAGGGDVTTGSITAGGDITGNISLGAPSGADED